MAADPVGRIDDVHGDKPLVSARHGDEALDAAGIPVFRFKLTTLALMQAELSAASRSWVMMPSHMFDRNLIWFPT